MDTVRPFSEEELVAIFEQTDCRTIDKLITCDELRKTVYASFEKSMLARIAIDENDECVICYNEYHNVKSININKEKEEITMDSDH